MSQLSERVSGMRSEPWLSEAEQDVWRDWLTVQARVPGVLNRELQADRQLSLQDFDVLVRLSEAPAERLRVSLLAEALGWEQSRLSHHLVRMAKRGLVSREPCPDDARGSFACLTDQGRERLVAAAPGHAATVRRLLFDRLSPAQLAALADLTGTILTALDAADA